MTDKTVESTDETWVATTKLRIVKPVIDFGVFLGMGTDSGKLQQLWHCQETGETEWRDVEVIKMNETEGKND